MTIYLAETFAQDDNVLDQLPAGWTGSNTYWSVKQAPSWATGLIAQGILQTTDQNLTKGLSSAAGSGTTVRVLFGTDGTSAERCGNHQFYSSGTEAFGFLPHSNGNVLLYELASGANITLVTGWASNTLYDCYCVIGAAGAITAAGCNGVAASGLPLNMANSHTSIDTCYLDVYNGGAGGVLSHAQVDAVIVDTSTAVPNGTISASGTQDGWTLGADKYGGVMIGYANGSSPASAIYKLERSSDGGTTWASVGFSTLATASGFIIWDGRPRYGSQPVTAGNTATYRVTAMNATGNQVL